MDPQAYFKTLKDSPRPVVVDFWAPWCGPCKVVKPVLEKLAGEYSGRVDLWQVNADENQDLLRELKIYGIPTLIVYRDGREVMRQVGAKSAGTLQKMFESLTHGEQPAPAGPSPVDRFIRMGAGFAIAAIGWGTGSSWLLLLLGGLLMFSAVHDRCPIWRALTDQFKRISGRA